MIHESDRWLGHRDIAGLFVAVVDGLVILDVLSVWAQAIGLEGVAAAATGLGALGASVAAVVAARQLYDQREVAAWASNRDALWHFNEEWERIAPQRQRLLKALRRGPLNLRRKQNDAIDVWNFFDGLAYMANRGRLNDELTWNWYYDDASYTWNQLQRYVRSQTVDNPALWCEIPEWLDRIEPIEQRYRARAHAATRLSDQGPRSS